MMMTFSLVISLQRHFVHTNEMYVYVYTQKGVRKNLIMSCSIMFLGPKVSYQLALNPSLLEKKSQCIRDLLSFASEWQ
jgi:hypothetical protein